MKAASVWTAPLFLIAVWMSACGEEPTATSTRLTPESDSRFPSSRHALTCSEDTTPPVLSISDQDLSYECTGGNGNAWVAPHVTAEDACEGPVPVHGYNTGDDDGDGVPGSTDPDDFGPGPTTETEGLYYVQYAAWDSRFNIQTAILAVNVQDTLPPVLTLNGAELVQTQCFKPTDDPTDPDTNVEVDPDPYIEQGATAEDQCYGDLSPQVVTSGGINKQSPGVYTVEYDVEDSGHHMATPITRAVEVIDTLAPKIITQPFKVTRPRGQLQVVRLSECAIAWDLCDGYMDVDMTGTLETVTSNDPGNDSGDIQLLDTGTFAVRIRNNANGSNRIYTVRFQVSDSSGNVAEGMCTLSIPISLD